MGKTAKDKRVGLRSCRCWFWRGSRTFITAKQRRRDGGHAQLTSCCKSMKISIFFRGWFVLWTSVLLLEVGVKSSVESFLGKKLRLLL
jgi:hypothetical protein